MQQLEQTMRDEGALQARGLHTHLGPNLALTPDQAQIALCVYASTRPA